MSDAPGFMDDVCAASRLEPCRVCKQQVNYHFKALVLGKYQVAYGLCPACGLMQTEKPYWLAEAYAQTISAQDMGLVRRNLRLSEVIQEVILDHFHPGRRFLDYAGGCGLLVRLLRDAGFDFHRHDPLCANMFAAGFDIPKLQDEERFELITACELFEHLVEPQAELRKLFSHTDSVFFSTQLCPEATPRSVEDWWYFFPETGQHLTFYTLDALRRLAKTTGAQLYSDGDSLHLFTKRTLSASPFRKPGSLLRRLDRMLARLRRSLRKSMFAAPPPASLLTQDAMGARSGASSSMESARKPLQSRP